MLIKYAKKLYKNVRKESISSWMSDEHSKIQLEDGWKNALLPEFSKDYMVFARKFIGDRLQQGARIYPEPKNIFKAFNVTPLDKVKVVILGQDPYHGPMQANGLCFSVDPGITLPPSLVNIFKELESDMGIPRPKTGDLTAWAKQGVLLLNSVLTVEVGKPGSHRMLQWETFTDKAISELSLRRNKVVFILWGAYAMSKLRLIDQTKHRVISGVHPSPLSAYKGFFGSQPFSQTNTALEEMGQTPIDWKLS